MDPKNPECKPSCKKRQQVLNRLLQEAAMKGHIINAKKWVKSGAEVDFTDKSSINAGKIIPKELYRERLSQQQILDSYTSQQIANIALHSLAIFDNLTPLVSACFSSPPSQGHYEVEEFLQIVPRRKYFRSLHNSY